MKTVLCVLISLAFASSAIGQISGTIYASSLAANDSGDATTPATAKTLAGALAYINSEGVDGHLELRVLNDGTYSWSSAVEMTATGTKDRVITIAGRNATDTAYEQATIDGGGTLDANFLSISGSFYCIRTLHFTGQDVTPTSPSTYALYVGATIDATFVYDCKFSNVWTAVAGGAADHPVKCLRCEVDHGYFKAFLVQTCVDCVVHDWYGSAFYDVETCIGCAAFNGLGNTPTGSVAVVDNDAFHRCGVLYGCTVYKAGIPSEAEGQGVVMAATGTLVVGVVASDCQENAFNGAGPSGGGILLHCGDYNCSARTAGTGRIFLDIDGQSLTANPFVDPDNGDIALNSVGGGGALLRNAMGTLDPSGSFTDYGAVGASQPESGGLSGRSFSGTNGVHYR